MITKEKAVHLQYLQAVKSKLILSTNQKDNSDSENDNFHITAKNEKNKNINTEQQQLSQETIRGVNVSDTNSISNTDVQSPT